MNRAARRSFLIAATAMATLLNYSFDMRIGLLLGPENYGMFEVTMAFLIWISHIKLEHRRVAMVK